MYLLMPVTFTVLTHYPRLRPYCGPVGLMITVASLILSSYATQIWQLIVSQGVLCAIGSSLMFSPTTLCKFFHIFLPHRHKKNYNCLGTLSCLTCKF